jgi:pimeloyl-ACP methyl ester carboxylesterase
MKKKYVTLKNGETLSYLEQGKGEQELLLIHGNFSSSLHFSTLLEKLPKTIHVLACDLRGFGDSTYHDRIEKMADFADDVALFMDALNVDRAVVLGWSLGGGVAMELAANHPHRVEKLILVHSTTHKGYPIFKKDEQGKPIVGATYKSADELIEDHVQVLPLFMAQKNNDFDTMNYVFDQMIYTVNKPDPKDNELWIKESLKQRNLLDADWTLANLNMSSQNNYYTDGTNTIQKIEVPVLHTKGKQDITVPDSMIKDNYEALKSHSTLIEYDQCGHSPFVDVLDDITDDILRFIAK